jgi:hypothetical protein
MKDLRFLEPIPPWTCPLCNLGAVDHTWLVDGLIITTTDTNPWKVIDSLDPKPVMVCWDGRTQ